MKTVNLTPWCNLFSIASKYNIEVKKSHYKVFIIVGMSLQAAVFLLVVLTYAYHLALVISGVSLLVLSLLFTQRHNQSQSVLYQFELAPQGLCVFSDGSKWQLQQASRLSFFGCWLVLIPLTASNSLLLNEPKQVFIFRDSLSQQDFSRLSLVLKNLSAQW